MNDVIPDLAQPVCPECQHDRTDYVEHPEGPWDHPDCPDCLTGQAPVTLAEYYRRHPEDREDRAFHQAVLAVEAEHHRLFAQDTPDQERERNETPDRFLARRSVEAAEPVLLAASATEIARLTRQVRQLRDRMESIRRNDRSTPYEYGAARPDGTPPESGERWFTPREIAEDSLRATSDQKASG